jgi:hypothetical protein
MSEADCTRPSRAYRNYELGDAMNAWRPPSFLADELERLQVGSGFDDPAVARGLLVAYGKCVVHDVSVGQPAVLTPDVAIPGAVDLTREIEAGTAGIGAAVERWRDADSQFESDAIVAGLLELRMDAWYAAEAMERLAEGCNKDARGRLEAAMTALDAAAHAYSQSLEDNLDVLSTAVGTPLLQNWRAMLPSRHDPLPWWLDGTLESAALELSRDFDRSIDAWRPRRRSEAISIDRAREISRASDAPLRRAYTALAADAPNQIMSSIEWTLPGTSLQATLYVPPVPKAGAALLLELQDTTGGVAAFDAVGNVSFLNGDPLHWRLDGSVERPVVSASWSLGGPGQLSDSRTLQLVDGTTGEEWTLSSVGN